MNEEQTNLMLKLQQLGLTMDDLREYLDTHPQDSFAIERFNMSAQEYRQVLEQFADSYGPISWTCDNWNENEWLWARQDFPWAY